MGPRDRELGWAEWLTLAALLVGWALLTLGIALLTVGQWFGAVWAISGGCLFLSFCGWGFLRQLFTDGFYMLSQDRDRE